MRGDSPQCGEMSRSDRGARARRAPPAGGEGWPGVAISWLPATLQSPSVTAFPFWHFVPPPPYRGSLSSRGAALLWGRALLARAILRYRKTPRANTVRPYAPVPIGLYGAASPTPRAILRCITDPKASASPQLKRHPAFLSAARKILRSQTARQTPVRRRAQTRRAVR